MSRVTRERGPRARRRVARAGLVSVVALAPLFAGSCARPGVRPVEEPAPRRVEATVVWARGARAYVASRDSGALALGMRVRLLDHTRVLAEGEIARMADPTLAIVELASGSLAGVRRLDHLVVVAEAPRWSATGVLRLGVPADGRGNLLFRCPHAAPKTSALPDGYRVEPVGDGSVRLVRTEGAPASAPWPDTLAVRPFAVAVDEEIAVERGELDAALFWPGELSTRMREDPRWAVLPAVAGAGVVAAVLPPGTPSPSATGTGSVPGPLAELDDALFRGDLERWTGPVAPALPAWPRPARFEVDSTIAGREVVQRFLDRAAGPAPDRAAGPAPAENAARTLVRVSFVVVEAAPPDSVAGRIARRLGVAPERVVPLYRPRLALVCRAPSRPLLAAIGPAALAALLGCGGSGSAP